MRLALFALLAIATLGAQTAPSDQPQYFVAAGGAYNYYSPTPKAAGFLSAAVRIADWTYSISTLDMTPTSSSLRTGFARMLQSSGNFKLFAHVDGGLTTGSATGVNSVVLGSFSGGGLMLYDLGGLHPKMRGSYAVGVVRILSISGNSVQPVFEFGFGKSF